MNKTLIFAILALAVLISGCGAQKPEPRIISTNAVDIQGFVFIPDTITVTKGTNVTWTNKDTAPHTVKGTGFISGTLNQGQTYSKTFNEAGTFEYVCGIHPGMKGKVIVS
ncbi:MAG: cupredoxin family copper-binding protein [Candidatus Methanoperedens sp.]